MVFGEPERRPPPPRGSPQPPSCPGVPTATPPPTPGRFLSRPPLQCRMECKDVPAETLYDVLHDIEYRKKWDTNVIETFDIGKLTVNSDVGYYACEEGAGGCWGGGS